MVLGVTPRSTKADINEAFEDALLDANDVQAERRLNLARQALFTPNERVAAELGYLLELRPSDARQALKSSSFDQWMAVAATASGVAKANVLAEAISTCADEARCQSVTVGLLDCWDEITPREIWLRIKEERSISDFGNVVESDVERGLDGLRKTHAELAVAHLDSTVDLPSVLTDLVENELIPRGRIGEKFASALIASYAQRKSGALAGAADRSVGCLDEFVASGSEKSFGEFEQALKHWDRLAQPLQLASQTKGADDLHSHELYETIRSRALSLANEEERHADASRITRLAQDIFAELPSAFGQLREDSETLNEILEHSATTKVLAPLAQAVADARQDLAWMSHYLSRHGFVSNAPDPIGAIRRSFDQLLTPDLPVETRDHGARILRGLAVELFNERADLLNARSLTAFLASNGRWFSRDVKILIAADERELAKNLALQHLQEAMREGEWKKARSILSELREVASDKEMADLHNVGKLIDDKIRSRRTSLIVWGSIAAMVVGFMVSSENETPDYDTDYTTDYNYSAPPTVENEPDSDIIAAPIGEPAVLQPEEDIEEEIAPYSSGGNLSLAQLRYCMRQGERLDLARPMVNSYSQGSRFNAAIDNYNLRCSSFRYDQQDMATVQSEIARMGARLREEAASIVGSASSPVAPSYTPTPSEPEVDETFLSEGFEAGGDGPEVYEPADSMYSYGGGDE